jgi:hypothetical protein
VSRREADHLGRAGRQCLRVLVAAVDLSVVYNTLDVELVAVRREELRALGRDRRNGIDSHSASEGARRN